MEIINKLKKQFSPEDLKDQEKNEEERTKQKQIRLIVTNLLIICAILAYFYYNIYPQLNAIQEVAAWVQTNFDYNERIKKNWISSEDLTKILAKNVKKKDNLQEILKDKNEILKLVGKPATYKWNYLEWVAEELLKKNEFEEELRKNDEIIANIIPDYYPLWIENKEIKEANELADLKNRINLYSFIYYIEDNILKKYNFVSNSAIWINNVKFENWKSWSGTIWTFSFKLDFKWKNSDIRSFLDRIQDSWKIEIKDWKINPKNPDSSLTSLNNLLITINDLSLTELLTDPSKENTWIITLNFYVKSVDPKDVLETKKRVIERIWELKTLVTKWISICSNWADKCRNNTEIATAMSELKKISTQLDTIKKDLEWKDWKKKQDTVEDYENIFKTNSLLSRLQDSTEKNTTLINNILGKWQPQK